MISALTRFIGTYAVSARPLCAQQLHERRAIRVLCGSGAPASPLMPEDRARPTLDLLRELAPDVRGVEMMAEAFDLPVREPEFRHRVDAAAAEHILNHIDPSPGEARNASLRALRARGVAAAVTAAWAWPRASVAAEDARRHVAQARAEGWYWIDALEQRCEKPGLDRVHPRGGDIAGRGADKPGSSLFKSDSSARRWFSSVRLQSVPYSVSPFRYLTSAEHG